MLLHRSRIILTFVAAFNLCRYDIQRDYIYVLGPAEGCK